MAFLGFLVGPPGLLWVVGSDFLGLLVDFVWVLGWTSSSFVDFRVICSVTKGC